MIAHEHTKVCFATGCPAIREAHQQQARERFARVQAAVARELDALGLTPGHFYAESITGAAIDAIFPPTDGPQPGDVRPAGCQGRESCEVQCCMDGGAPVIPASVARAYGPTAVERINGSAVECRRCKGHGWTGPNDPRPGVTCDDCDGTGARPRHEHSWAEDRVGNGHRAHLRDQVCIVCRERRTVAS